MELEEENEGIIRREVNGRWALRWLSEDLKRLKEKEGEYWALQVSENEEDDLYLEPVMKIDLDKDKFYLDEKYNPKDTGLELETNSQILKHNIYDLMANTGYGNLLHGREKEETNLEEVPEIDSSRLDHVEMNDELIGKYVAPGMEGSYRETATETVERILTHS